MKKSVEDIYIRYLTMRYTDFKYENGDNYIIRMRENNYNEYFNL